jgi:hypothetical protein
MSERDGIERRLRRTSSIMFTGIGVTVVLAVVLLCVVAFVYRPRIERLIDGTRAVRHEHSAMLDEETGARGYLLSRDTSFLAPYTQGKLDRATANAEAHSLLAGDSEIAAEYTKMEATETRWMEQWSEVAIHLADSKTAIPPGFYELGRQLFDDYRNQERVVETLADQHRGAAVTNMFRIFGAGSALSLAVGAGLLVLTRRRARSLRRAVQKPGFGLRLREIVAHRFRDPSQLRPITVSVGTAAIPRDAMNAAGLIAAADAALYKAKAAGRDRVRSASPVAGAAS